MSQPRSPRSATRLPRHPLDDVIRQIRQRISEMEADLTLAKKTMARRRVTLPHVTALEYRRQLGELIRLVALNVISKLGDLKDMMPEGRPHEAIAYVAPDVEARLVELVKGDRRVDFEWLARSAGVAAIALDQLWEGARARIRLRRPRATLGHGADEKKGGQ